MDELIKKTKELMRIQHFPLIQVGVLDFSFNKQFVFELDNETNYCGKPVHYFDLASLTKPLTLSNSIFYHQNLIDNELKLLLNHRAGLPAFGRLSLNHWKEEILSYGIKESPTVYSDYSALRLMIELERKSGKKLSMLSNSFVGSSAIFWQDLKDLKKMCAPTGIRNGKVIQGEPNDDNAFNLKEFCSHAGLFSKMDLFTSGLLKLWKDGFFSWVDSFYKNEKNRFIMGLDRPFGGGEPFASKLASKRTYGFLGFTGTSFWIDVEKSRGIVIFTNATKNYSYDRTHLNFLRRTLAEFVFSSTFQL